MAAKHTTQSRDDIQESQRPWSLSYQISLALVLGTFICAVVVGQFVYWYEVKHLRGELDNRTRQTASLISSVIVDAMITEDKALIETIIGQAAKAMPEIHFLDVHNEDGVMIAHWEKKNAHHPQQHMALEDKIVFEGETFGALKIQWDLSKARLHIDEHVNIVRLYVAGGMLLLALIIFAIMQRVVGRPIRNVHDQLLLAAEGKTIKGNLLPKHTARELVDVQGAAIRLSELYSENKAFENESRMAHELLEDAINSLSDGFVIYDADDRLVICNQKYKDIYKESADLIVPGATFEKIIRHGAQRGQYGKIGPSINEWVKERLHQHKNPSGAIEQQLNNGRWLRIEERKTKAGGIVGFRVDITELKQRQIELKNAKNEAESASQVKSQFLATMSHEIRTPINTVLGVFGLLHDTSLNPEQSKYSDTGRRAAEALLAIINDILDFSKMEAGRLDLEVADLDLQELIDAVTDVIGSRADERGIQLEAVVTPNTPQYLIGDSGRLHQILLNLIGNAIKFTDKGSVTIKVSTIDETPDNAKLCFEVIDTGIGIDPEHHAEIFSEFTTLTPVYTQKFGGTGLGLAISNRLVKMMDGEIGFTSELGVGSSFWFSVTLPKLTPSQIEEYKRETSSQLEAIQKSLNGRVLLAEDNPANKMIAQVILEKAGLDVDTAADGLEAVAAVKQRSYDLILMDVGMPEMDGIEATTFIRKMSGPQSKTPIVAMTAHVVRGDRESLLSKGMDDYLAKPATKRQLLAIVEKWLGTKAIDDIPAYDSASSQVFNENPTLDTAPLLQLAMDVDAEMVPELVNTFIEHTKDRLKTIQQAIETKDMALLEAQSHALKSSAATFGVMRFHKLCSDLENACKSQDNDLIAQNADRIFVEGDAAIAELEKYLKDFSAD